MLLAVLRALRRLIKIALDLHLCLFVLFVDRSSSRKRNLTQNHKEEHYSFYLYNVLLAFLRALRGLIKIALDLHLCPFVLFVDRSSSRKRNLTQSHKEEQYSFYLYNVLLAVLRVLRGNVFDLAFYLCQFVLLVDSSSSRLFADMLLLLFVLLVDKS